MPKCSLGARRLLTASQSRPCGGPSACRLPRRSGWRCAPSMILVSRRTCKRERFHSGNGERQSSRDAEALLMELKNGLEETMKRIYFIGLLALGSVAIGVGSSQAADVKIGVVQGLSGPPAIVDFGESYLQGSKHKIELVIYDDEANPQKAVSLVQRLMQNDKVPVIIGTGSSGNALAFAPIMQKAGVPLVAGPSIATNITAQFINESPSYIFRCSMVEKHQIDAMLDWGVKTFKKIGLINSTTGYGS